MNAVSHPDELMLVDACGHRCPVPTLRLQRALADLAPGALVVLVCDDPLARIDVPHFVSTSGHTLLEQGMEGARLRFTLRRGASAGGEDRG